MHSKSSKFQRAVPQFGVLKVENHDIYDSMTMTYVTETEQVGPAPGRSG